MTDRRDAAIATTAGDDRVLGTTRVVALVVALVLLAAFFCLYAWPDRTDRTWAWTVKPTLTAMLMGAGYLAGAYYFLHVLWTQQWHRVGAAFPAIALFATAMGVATALHWPRFNRLHPWFWMWLGLYVTAPFVITALWLANRRQDPVAPAPGDIVVPLALRRLVLAAGAVVSIWGVTTFVQPAVAIAHWGWTVTPLTARVIAGWFMLSGVIAIRLGREPRWTAWRVLVRTGLLWVGLLLVAAGRAWPEFDPGKPATTIYVAGLCVSAAIMFAALVRFDRRRSL